MVQNVFVILILLLTAWYQSALAQQPNLMIPTGHVGGVQRVEFCKKRNLLASAGDTSVKLWDAVTGTELRTFDSKFTRTGALAFSPDCKLLAASSSDIINIWNVETSAPPLTLKGHRELVWSIALSSDGRLLASAGSDKTIKLWDVNKATLVRNVGKLNNSVDSLIFADNDNVLASASGDEKGINIWDVKTGRRRATLTGHTRGVTSLSLSPDGKLLASGSWDDTVRLWNVPSWLRVRRIQSHTGRVSSVSFSGDGRVLATASNKSIKIWDVPSGSLRRVLRGFSNDVMQVAFAPEDKLLASITWGEAAIRIWDISSSKAWSLSSHATWINAAALSPDGTMLASGDIEGGIRLWRLRGNIDLRTLVDRSKLLESEILPRITALIFSSDGTVLALARADQTVELWNVTTGNLTYTLGKHSDTEFSQLPKLSFSPDGRLLATVTDNKAINLWDVSSGGQVRTITGRFGAGDGRPGALAFSPDGKVLASVDYSSIPRQAIGADIFGDSHPPRIKLWKVTKGQLLATLGGEGPTFGVVEYFDPDFLAFSPNGDSVIARESFNGKYKVWDVLTKKELQAPKVSPSLPRFGPDQSMVEQANLIAYWWKASITLYDASSYGTPHQRILATLVALDRNDWVVVAPDFRFTTNRIDNPMGLQWTLPEAPISPLPLEIFMRDYYEPKLLPRILKGKEDLPRLPSVADLNRLQPKVERVTVTQHSSDARIVDVTVRVTSVAGECLREGKRFSCESGVYDLRLYRDGQMVGESPAPRSDDSVATSGASWREHVQQWRQTSLVANKDGKPVTAASGPQEITFRNIQLPKRSGLSQVAFTAYAFNEDRVKSATSPPTVWPLSQPRPGAQRRAYLLTVGVDVTSAGWRLGFARNGVREVEGLLKDKLQSQYEVVPVQLMSAYKADSGEVEDLARKGNLKTVLNILSGRDVTKADHEKVPHEDQLQRATPDDLVVLYIASHGYVDPTGKFYVIPSDIGQPLGVSEESLDRCLKNSEQSSICESGRKLLQHSISSDELTQWIEAIDAGQMVLILDSCHSGAVSGPSFKPGPMGDRSFGQLSYDKGMLVLAATQADQLDTGTLELGNRSLLTYALTQQTTRSSFDLRQWLSDAEKQVPKLYQQFVKSDSTSTPNDESDQEPILFDFSKQQPRLVQPSDRLR